MKDCAWHVRLLRTCDTFSEQRKKNNYFSYFMTGKKLAP